jgi:hypothetical protein
LLQSIDVAKREATPRRRSTADRVMIERSKSGRYGEQAVERER